MESQPAVSENVEQLDEPKEKDEAVEEQTQEQEEEKEIEKETPQAETVVDTVTIEREDAPTTISLDDQPTTDADVAVDIPQSTSVVDEQAQEQQQEQVQVVVSADQPTVACEQPIGVEATETQNQCEQTETLAAELVEAPLATTIAGKCLTKTFVSVLFPNE